MQHKQIASVLSGRIDSGGLKTETPNIADDCANTAAKSCQASFGVAQLLFANEE